MPMYEFECPFGCRIELFMNMDEVDSREVKCPDHPLLKTEWVPQPFTGTYKWTPGKETGVYKHDYGLYATHDMTVPGKIEHLKSLGDPRFEDPFD